MTRKRIKSQDENITTEDLGNGYTRIRVEGPNSVQRARDFIDTNFDNPAYYQGDLKDLEVVAYDPKSLASKEADRFSRMVGFPTASEMGTTYKYVEPSKPKVDDGFTDAFNKYKKGLITLQDYKKIFNDWVVPLGGRPLQFTTNSYGRVLPIHPHPYIYIKRRGGKLCKKLKNI